MTYYSSQLLILIIKAFTEIGSIMQTNATFKSYTASVYDSAMAVALEVSNVDATTFSPLPDSASLSPHR
ncbi:MAG: hypothetical protein JO235_12210 [Chroococcidiopsidaceae cyanobacterium CP_BM_RX_35]|nr:hypothetical protein [Chroococcidiopsidaceae cyanobacterium CP_BM_RX_35]